jgi:DNA recombination protein RmuC
VPASPSLMLAFLAGLLIGVVVAYALARGRGDAATGRADELRVRVQALEADAGALRERAAAADRARVEAETRNVAAERRVEDERRFVDEARDRLTDAFKALAADALSGSQRDFLQLADEKFKALREDASGDLETRRVAIQALVGPLQQALEGYQKEARGIEERRQRDLGAVGEQLRDVAVAHLALRAETNKLVQALRAPNVRGRWGEVALRRVAELAGMSTFCDFVEQETVNGETSRLRPDVIVRLPSERVVVIDAKVPLAAYLDAVEAGDEYHKDQALARHLLQVRAHVTRLAARGYALEIEQTAEFVVLFIPNDSFLAAAAERDPDLIDWALGQRVVLATPATLFALLRAVEYGWRQERVAEDAQKISAVGRELSERMASLVEHLSHMGGSLGKTVKAYNQAVASLESRVLPTARKLESLGAGSRKPIQSMQPIDQAPRQIVPQQLTLEP